MFFPHGPDRRDRWAGARAHGTTTVTAAIAILLGLPLIMLAANDEWIFDSTHFFDTNVYVGFFRHYLEFKMPFVANYKSSRLPFVLPGVLAYHLFSPVVAHHVLFLAFRSAETVLLFAMVKRHYGARTAFVTTAVSAVFTVPHPLTSYHVQTTSTYLIAALASIDLPRRRPLPIRALGAGFFFALGTTTDTVLIALIPMLGLYALTAEPRPYRVGRLALIALSLAGGAVGALALTGLVNVALGGPFLFFLDQLHYSLHVAKGQAISLVPLADFVRHLSEFPWLVLPLVASAGALGVLVGAVARRGRWKERPALDAACLLISVAVAAVMQVRGLGVLEYPHLFHPFYIPIFLGLPAILSAGRRRFDVALGPVFMAIVALAALVPLMVLGEPISRLLVRLTPRWPAAANGVPFGLAAVVIGLGAGWFMRSRARVSLAVSAACLSLANGFCVTPWQPAYVYQLGGKCRFRRDAFQAIIAADDAIAAFDPENEARWASSSGPLEYPDFDGTGWCQRLPVQTVARSALLTHYFYTTEDFISGVRTPPLKKIVLAGTSRAEVDGLEAQAKTGLPPGATLARTLDRQFAYRTFVLHLRGLDVTRP